MKNGSYLYRIELNAPLGARNGELEIRLTENEIAGDLAILGKISTFAHGRYETGIIMASGQLKTVMYDLPYELIGEMDEEAIRFEMQTSRGVFPATGARICG